MASTAGPSGLSPDKLKRNRSSEILMQLESTLDRSKTPERKPLPDIRKSKTMEVAHVHNDFLPEEVMAALTQPAEVAVRTLVPSREQSLGVSTTASRRPPANVWNHKSRRDKLKHLTDQSVCFCGAGRDISFLYDVPAPEEPKPTAIVKKDASKPREAAPLKKPLELPNSLVPDEYHIVKNKGVLGLEYYESVKKYHNLVIQKGAKKLQFIDDDYTTQPEDHEAHLTVFPSMKPTSRYEVMRLKEVMEDLMEKSGVNDEAIESVGPTQMHNLIELIKKEQKIYNIIFHELIRQATIECTERGELLADIRQKYSNLLSKVPKQIRGLHDEVMAQRALDRRLTEELFRFKAQIVALTNELTEVKEHDKLVTEQAKRAQEDLRSALMESQKNASLLGEYHDLYELQRQRLEKLVSVLTSEKELWSTATYSLSIKVIEEGNMVTARRAYIAEKAWSKLTHHFAVLLSDKDTEVLTRLQEHMERWRDQVESFHISIKEIEDEVEDALKNVRANVVRWIDDFKKNCLVNNKSKSKDGAFVKAPNQDKAKQIYAEIKEWASLLQTELDKFSGSLLLSNNDALSAIEHEISGWTECGVEVFNRHRHQDEYPNDYKVMIKLNKTLRDMCQQYSNRVTGENGIAKYMIQINTGFETWENKLVSIIHAGQSLPQSDNESYTLELDENESQSVQSLSTTVVDNKKVKFQGAKTQTVRRIPKYHAPFSTTRKVSKESKNKKARRKSSTPQWKKEDPAQYTKPLDSAAQRLSITVTPSRAYGSLPRPNSLETEGSLARDMEWMAFMEQLDDWVAAIDNCIESVGSVNTEDDKEKGNVAQKIDVHEMMRKAHMWSVTTNNSIDSEDSKYVEQVTQLHTQMVKWMVHVLLRLAPDKPETSIQSIEQSLVNSPPIADLVEEAEILFQQLDSFSLLIHRSCEDIVRLRTQDRISSGDEMAEKELNDLQGLKYEAYHWIYAACILIVELANENIEYTPQDKKFSMAQFSKARTAKSHVLDYMDGVGYYAEAQSSVAGDDEPAALLDEKLEDSPPKDSPQKDTPMKESPQKDTPMEESRQDSNVQSAETPNVLKVEGADDSKGVSEKEKTLDPIPPSQPKPSEASRPPSVTKLAGQTPGPGSRQASAAGSRQGSVTGSRPASPKDGDDSLSKIEVIGRDDNTRPALLPEPSPDEPPPRPSSGKPMAVDSQKAYDALKTVQKLQVQLLETEQRAQTAEESEAKKSAELVEALKKLRALERQMEEIQNGGRESTPKPAAAPAQTEEVASAEPAPASAAAAPSETSTEKTEVTKKKSKSGRPSSQSKKKK